MKVIFVIKSTIENFMLSVITKMLVILLAISKELMPVDRSAKQLMFNDDKYHRVGRVTPSLLEQVISHENLSVDNFMNISMKT